MIVQLKMRATCVSACMLEWICVRVFVEIYLKAIRNTLSNYVVPDQGRQGNGEGGVWRTNFSGGCDTQQIGWVQNFGHEGRVPPQSSSLSLKF